MLQLRSWPTAILHLDGDSFFASVAQAVNPKLKGKPLVTGNERGVATSVSYEAKKLGIVRATPVYQIKKHYPTCLIVDSDYELYDLFSQKMFSILRQYSPTVEEYSIDEAFADIKGLRRPLNMGYYEIGESIKKKIESSLGISVSVGISLTKSLAKLASSYRKPSGLTVVSGRNIEKLLKATKIGDVWGIGENTSSYLRKNNITTALDFALLPEERAKTMLSKPFQEMWRELRGEKIYEVDTNVKSTYRSITRSHTFTPTSDLNFLWAQLLHHVEDAFETARQTQYHVGKINIFLKTQQFNFHQREIKFNQYIQYPFSVRDQLQDAFKKIYQKNVLYRTTGCTISNLSAEKTVQTSLFTEQSLEEKAKKIYPLYETKKVNFGTVLYERENMNKKKEKTKMELPVISLS